MLLFSGRRVIIKNQKILKQFLTRFRKKEKKEPQKWKSLKTIWDCFGRKLKAISELKQASKPNKQVSGSVQSVIKSSKPANFWQSIRLLSTKKSNSRFKLY